MNLPTAYTKSEELVTHVIQLKITLLLYVWNSLLIMCIVALMELGVISYLKTGMLDWNEDVTLHCNCRWQECVENGLLG